MTDLRAALADYLALRRALGYKLAADERLLRQFLRFMKANDATVITAALALKWATLPSGARPGWLAQRLSAVRLFAVFAASLDEATQVPPAGCPPIPSSPDRRPAPRPRRDPPPRRTARGRGRPDVPLALAEKAHPAHAEAHLRHAPARKRDRHATIALWLGHETSRTTEIYLHAYLALKERAIQRTAPPSTASGRYRPPDRLLAFLEAL